MATRRQQIVSALVTALGLVKVANSYATNAGLIVKLNPDKTAEPIGDNELSAFVIHETGGTEQAGMAGEDFGTLELDLMVVAQALRSLDPDANARLANGDMIAAIGVDKTLGGLCDDLSLTSVDPESDQKSKRVCVITHKARITYRTTRWAPSTSPA